MAHARIEETFDIDTKGVENCFRETVLGRLPNSVNVTVTFTDDFVIDKFKKLPMWLRLMAYNYGTDDVYFRENLLGYLEERSEFIYE